MPMLIYRKNYVFLKFYNSNYIILYIIIAYSYMNPPLIYFFKLCFFKLCAKSAPPGSSSKRASSSRREFQEYSCLLHLHTRTSSPADRAFQVKNRSQKEYYSTEQFFFSFSKTLGLLFNYMYNVHICQYAYRTILEQKF